MIWLSKPRTVRLKSSGWKIEVFLPFIILKVAGNVGELVVAWRGLIQKNQILWMQEVCFSVRAQFSQEVCSAWLGCSGVSSKSAVDKLRVTQRDLESRHQLFARSAQQISLLLSDRWSILFLIHGDSNYCCRSQHTNNLITIFLYPQSWKELC